MGGSGSNSEWVRDPNQSALKAREAENKTVNIQFETEIRAVINSILSAVNNRDVTSIQRHIEEVKNSIEKLIEGTIDIRYGGSVAKHTYVDGLSDIDTLAIINNSSLSDKSPTEVKQYFYNRLVERFPNTNIKIGNLAITLKYADGVKLQVLPALKTSTGFKIANSDNEWIKTNPEKFAIALRSVNITNSGKAIPVIKLAKSIISDLPERRQIKGYHVEALAIDIFSRYTGVKTSKEMLKHFFKEAADRVLNPIKDKSGQSTHVDDYLGNGSSIERKMVSDSFAQISRKMQNADGGQMIEKWNEIFNL
jgi:hypothetical protein